MSILLAFSAVVIAKGESVNSSRGRPGRAREGNKMTAEKIREMKGPLMTATGGRTHFRENIEEGSELWFLREIAAQLAELKQEISRLADNIRE